MALVCVSVDSQLTNVECREVTQLKRRNEMRRDPRWCASQIIYRSRGERFNFPPAKWTASYDVWSEMHFTLGEVRGNSSERLCAKRFTGRRTPSRHFEQQLWINTFPSSSSCVLKSQKASTTKRRRYAGTRLKNGVIML